MTTTRHGIHLDNDLPVHMSYLDKITFSVDEDGEANGSVIQLLRTGSWNHPKYGRIQITEKTLDNLKRHFDENIRGVDLAIDTEHKAERGAKGWIKDVFIDETGSRLYGEVDWTPAGREMIKNGEYKYISAEYSPLYTDTETGHTFKDVLVGGALTNRPFIKDMEPVLLSEDIMEEVLEELEVSADEDYFEKGGNANLYYNPESIHFSEVAKSEKDEYGIYKNKIKQQLKEEQDRREALEKELKFREIQGEVDSLIRKEGRILPKDRSKVESLFMKLTEEDADNLRSVLKATPRRIHLSEIGSKLASGDPGLDEDSFSLVEQSLHDQIGGNSHSLDWKAYREALKKTIRSNSR